MNGRNDSSRIQNEEALHKRNERLQILSDCLAQLLSEPDVNQMVAHLFSKVAAHVGADAFFNYLIIPEAAALDLCARTGISIDTVNNLCEACSGGPRHCLAAQTRKILVAKDIQRSDSKSGRGRPMGVQACVCIPLTAGERLLGILSFASQSKTEFADDEIDFLQLLSRHIATAMERAKTEQAVLEAKQATEEASHTKDEFIATLSHELRTPLTPVLITATSLEQNEALAPAVREQIAVIRRNVELEARLIDDLLDLTKIERGKFSLRPENVDVHELLAGALEIVREEIVLKQLTVGCNSEARWHIAEADPARLQQVFWNLLRNAIKFTPPGGGIQIRTFNPDQRSIAIEFQDTGIGIAPENIERIFTPFNQGSAVAGHCHGGLGLGLTISESIIKLHHGVVTAASAGVNQGATFTVRIPIDSLARLPEKPKIAEPAQRAAHLHILLVEDNEQTREVLARILSQDGHDVQAEATCAAALKAIRACQPPSVSPFQVLISDIGLPDGSGLNLVRELKMGTPGLTAIALSGYGTREDIDKSIQAGFKAHLTKPVSIEALRHALAA